MANIRVLIVEDQYIVSEEIKEILSAKGYRVIGQCTSADTALDLLSKDKCDVAILDINIEGDRDGIELASEILEKHRCAIIFLTAYADQKFLDRAKKVKPAAYIVKPFEETNLHMAVEIAFNNLLKAGLQPEKDVFQIKDFIFIKDSTRYKKIELDQIRYAQAEGSYTKVLVNDHPITLAINLKTFESHLSSPEFMRIHRSYVVNLKKVEEFEGNRVFINQKSIPISSSFKADFVNKFTFL
ncbi:MAG: response regulator [Bacteroidota bacterium]